MFDRKFIISLILAISLIFVYQAYYQMRFGQYLDKAAQEHLLKAKQKKLDQEAKKETPVAQPATDPPGATAPLAAESGDFVPPQAVAGMETVAQTPQAKASTGEEITIDTGAATIVLSTRGATLKNYRMDGYNNINGEPAELILDPVVFAQEQEKKYKEAKEDGDEADFIKVTPYPTLGLKFPKEDFSRIINTAIFTYDGAAGTMDISQLGKPLPVTFELAHSTGVVVRKKYVFYPGEYEFDFTVEVVSAPQWGQFNYSVVWFGLFDDEPIAMQYLSYHRPMFRIGNQYRMDDPDEDKRVREYKGNIKWSAFTHKYYAVIGMPQGEGDSLVRTSYIDDYNTTLEWEYKSGAPNSIRFYLGPKRHEILDKFDHDQKKIIDYGWFNIIAQPMFWLLNKFQAFTGNWGWGIVMLTVLTKIALFPLSQKGFRSMKRLQKLQPQMKKLQDLYKDDKEKLNKELMEFYKTNKVNPMGGCLPMFLQIPIFFGLYKVLYESIELKGVPWILWITDLTEKDPYYVTPLIMGATMFVQQWMTPSTGDKTQRQIMLIMPVVFTFMFLSFPAGLILYWMVNNILSIIQQWIINREPLESNETPDKTA